MDKNKRWVTLDILKSFGILIVVIGHTFFWWYNDKGSYNLILFNLVGVLPASLPITAGAAFRSYVKKFFDDKKLRLFKNSGLIKKIVKRSFFLMSIGYLMNFLTWGKEELFTWDVLQFAAISILFLTIFLYFVSMWHLVIFTSLLLLLSPLIRDFLQSFYPQSYFTIITVGDIYGEHYWPFLPWFILMVYGFLLGHYYIYLSKKNKSKEFYLYFIVIGTIIFLGIFLTGNLFFEVDPSNIWSTKLMQPPIVKVIGFASIFTILISSVGFLIDKIKIKKYGFINTFSKGILWIYVLHTIIGYHLVRILLKNGLNNLFYLIITMILVLVFSYFIGLIVIWIKYYAKQKKRLHLPS